MNATASVQREPRLSSQSRIPTGWDITAIGELCATSSGTTPARKLYDRYYRGGIVPWVKTMDLNNSEIISTDESVTELALDETVLRKYPAGTVLVAMYGGFNQIGRTGLLRIPAAVNQAITAVQTNPKRLVPEFLLATLNYHVDYWRSVASSSRKDPNISSADIRGFPVLHPIRVEEQWAIAAALSDLDALVGALDKLIEKKRAIKLATMQQLLSGRVRLEGFTGTWRRTTWGEVITSCASGSTPSRARPDFYRGNIPWITSGELNYNVITDTIEKITAGAVRAANLKLVPVGTFLMAITGLEAEGTRGSCGLVGVPATTNQSCMAIYPKPELLSVYLFHFYVWRGKLLALQYCQGTKQQSYTASIVKKLPISFPLDVEEQKAIATALSDVDAEIAALEQRREKTKMIKQGMMQVLLTGKVRLV